MACRFAEQKKKFTLTCALQKGNQRLRTYSVFRALQNQALVQPLGAALYEARTAEQVWESFPLIEDSIYKRRSTGETRVALTETIYEKGKVVFLSFFPAGSTERSCVLWFDVVPVEHSLFFVQFRLTNPRRVVRLDQVRIMNLCPLPFSGTEVAGQRPLNSSRAGQERASDSTTGRMPGRRSSTVGSRRVRFGFRARTRKRRCTILAATYVDLDLTDSSNPIEPTLKGGLQVKGDAVKEVISIKIFLEG